MERIVVITGGKGGIGSETVKLFQESHDKVIILDRTVDPENEMHYTCDISDEETVKAVFEDIGKRFGRIDILINNAGYGMNGITELTTSEAARKIFDVNFFGLWLCTKYALPYILEGGKVINISSAMAIFPVAYRAFYGASKAAVSALTFAQRLELEKIGVDMCAICPGDIKTNFTANRVKNFETNERYGNNMKMVTQKMDRSEDKRIKPIVVAKAIFKISKKKRTKPMYIVGKKYKFLNFLKHIFPFSWLLWGCGKVTS